MSIPMPQIPKRCAQRQSISPLPHAEIKLPLPGLQPTRLSERQQLFVRERVQDAMIRLGDLVVAERHPASIRPISSKFPRNSCDPTTGRGRTPC